VGKASRAWSWPLVFMACCLVKHMENFTFRWFGVPWDTETYFNAPPLSKMTVGDETCNDQEWNPRQTILRREAYRTLPALVSRQYLALLLMKLATEIVLKTFIHRSSLERLWKTKEQKTRNMIRGKGLEKNGPSFLLWKYRTQAFFVRHIFRVSWRYLKDRE